MHALLGLRSNSWPGRVWDAVVGSVVLFYLALWVWVSVIGGVRRSIHRRASGKWSQNFHVHQLTWAGWQLASRDSPLVGFPLVTSLSCSTLSLCLFSFQACLSPTCISILSFYIQHLSTCYIPHPWSYSTCQGIDNLITPNYSRFYIG
jgi:hypothetical protein